MKKVSFDFDSTLSRTDIQEIKISIYFYQYLTFKK